MKSGISSRSVELLFEGEDNSPQLPDAIRDVVSHCTDEKVLKLRDSVTHLTRHELASVLADAKQSKFRQHVIRSFLLFDTARKALRARVDESWIDGKSASYYAFIASNRLSDLVISGLFTAEEMAKLNQMSLTEDPVKLGDYSSNFKREYLHVFSMARHRILELRNSLSPEFLGKFQRCDLPSEVRPLEEYCMPEQFLPYVRELYSDRPEAIELCERYVREAHPQKCVHLSSFVLSAHTWAEGGWSRRRLLREEV